MDGAEIIHGHTKFFSTCFFSYGIGVFFKKRPEKRKTKFDNFFVPLILKETNRFNRSCSPSCKQIGGSLLYKRTGRRGKVIHLCKQQPLPSTQDTGKLAQETTYKAGNTLFVVQPVFKDTGEETVGSVLLKLMCHEAENA